MIFIAYGDLIYDGDRPRSLYSIAGSERVIKLGTLSKLVAGGMRLGWAIAEPNDISRMCALKADNATGPFAAWVPASYLQSGALMERLPNLRELYRSRRDAMIQELRPLRELGCTWLEPAGGFFVCRMELIARRCESVLKREALPIFQDSIASPIKSIVSISGWLSVT